MINNNYPITGTFIDEITYDIPSSNWSKKNWQAEFDIMKDVGIDTVIIIRGGFGRKTLFPSKTINTHDQEDLAGFFFEEGYNRNINVIFGLYITDIDWGRGDYLQEIKTNKPFINEVLARYGDIPSFKGWYLPHETGRDELNIKELFQGLAGYCKDCSPDKKVMVSPFFMGETLGSDTVFSPEKHFEEWDKIFSVNKDIDICAFQDGTVPIHKMSEYYNLTNELCSIHGIEHWSNVETFERDVRKMYYPIPFQDLKRKIKIHNEYAQKMITFEFSHFLSPQSIYPSAHNLFNLYKDEYGH